MKKYLFLSVIVIFAVGFSVMAQDGQARRQGGRGFNVSPKERVEQLAKQVELTAEQQAQVLALYEKQDKARQEQFAKMRDGGQQMDREAMRAEFTKQQQANDAELEAIIGKEKMEKVKALREEQTPQRRVREQN